MFALRETLLSERHGHDVWFWQMTGIGPATTYTEGERAVFETRQEALWCPAFNHALSFYEVVEIKP